MQRFVLMTFVTLFSAFVLEVSAQVPQISPSSVPRVNGVIVEYVQSGPSRKSLKEFNLYVDNQIAYCELEDGQKLYVDYNASKYTYYAELPHSKTFATCSDFVLSKGMDSVGVDNILSWDCVKYVTHSGRDVVELWTTRDIGFNGTVKPELGVADGLLLKMVINGTDTIEAVRIKRTPAADIKAQPQNAEFVFPLLYKWLWEYAH